MRAMLIDPAHAWVEDEPKTIVFSEEFQEWLEETGRDLYPFWEPIPGGGFRVVVLFPDDTDELLFKLSYFYEEE